MDNKQSNLYQTKPEDNLLSTAPSSIESIIRLQMLLKEEQVINERCKYNIITYNKSIYSST